ncbi:GGDEF domain-containing protein [Permianibacter aggregans]|uniref:diguanylate cyclase n=1 Tax=Permianibacter aggregans TaxID=1510150 RepID=A0A4R6UGH8_9GAMM|nr:sensor domain-containing diguanylate cyclase [Permianibacter aggregans]TDQ45930.1 PAS domain S-box-containing protein/diguanylate cyclase (GGDEF)-like protein [Permianibacter aggregans]
MEMSALRQRCQPVSAYPSSSEPSSSARQPDPLVRQHWMFGTAQEESLRVVLNHVSEAILLLDQHGRIQLVNPFGEQLFGENRDAMLGKSWADYLEPPFSFEYSELFAQSSAKDLAERIHEHSPKEIMLRRQDGLMVDVDISLSIIPAERPLLVCIMRDLSAYKKEHDELRQLARTDYLTQVANRRAFDEVLFRQWQECSKTHVPLSVLLIDIDHFKQLNDQFGHLHGDQCLRRIASAIKSELPSPRMLAARYGGEEFAVILPGCNETQATALAETIRRKVAALSGGDQDVVNSHPLSISIGVACTVAQHLRDYSALVNMADVALYRAKISGRNRVEYCAGF